MTVEPLTEHALQPDDDVPSSRETYAFVLTVFGLFGVLALVAAVLIGTNKSDGAASTASEKTMVTLSEFKVAPADITASAAAGIHVANNGSVQHNLAVEGTSLATPMIDAGGSAQLDLSSLTAGDYTVYCQIPGHKEAGMTAALHVTAGGGGASCRGADGGHGHELDVVDVAGADGPGDEGLDRRVPGPDRGSRRASVGTDRARRRHQAVRAHRRGDEMGSVTGEDGGRHDLQRHCPGSDHQGRSRRSRTRSCCTIKLPESTSIHFHGLVTPNAMDGTTDITQDPVKPGTDFTYEWTVQSTPAVGMYHSHHDAVKQVPDGLAGAFLVGDEPVPAGVTVSQEQVMVLDDSGVIGYALNGKSFPATAPIVANDGRLGRGALPQRGNADPSDASARHGPARDRQGRLPARLSRRPRTP